MIVTPTTLDIEIGNTAVFTCEITPEIPSWLELSVTYRWTRGDNVEISQNAVGVNTNLLTVVSLVPFLLVIFYLRREVLKLRRYFFGFTITKFIYVQANVQKSDIGSYRCTVSTKKLSKFDIGIIAIKKCPAPNHQCLDLR